MCDLKVSAVTIWGAKEGGVLTPKGQASMKGGGRRTFGQPVTMPRFLDAASFRAEWEIFKSCFFFLNWFIVPTCKLRDRLYTTTLVTLPTLRKVQRQEWEMLQNVKGVPYWLEISLCMTLAKVKWRKY